MSEDRASRFKSRFSLLSLLPARHPPIKIGPPIPQTRDLPPTRYVEARHPTIVSVEDTISPVQSEYPLSAYMRSDTDSPAILSDFDIPPVPAIPSHPFSTPSPHHSSPSSTRKGRSPPHRPPPLDLRLTKEAYPGVEGVIATAGTIHPSFPPAVPPVPQFPDKGKYKQKGKEKPEKPNKVVDDPFDVVELESMHRYPSWQGGRVSIKPGQVIPRLIAPGSTPTIRGMDADEQRRSQASEVSLEHYDSVLHNVLLTPSYTRVSPAMPDTPSPGETQEHWGAKRAKRLTLLDAVRRSSVHFLTKGVQGAQRSIRDLRDQDQHEMDRFRIDSRSLRTQNDSSSAYSTASPLPQSRGIYSRRSPNGREWDVGLRPPERVQETRPGESRSWRYRKGQEKVGQRKKKLMVSLSRGSKADHS